MKIRKEMYDYLKADIKAVFAAFNINIHTAPNGKTGLLTMWRCLHIARQNRAYDNHPFFKNGTWTRVLPYDGTQYCCFYENNCNDTHVETALKKIKQELEADMKPKPLPPGSTCGGTSPKPNSTAHDIDTNTPAHR